jgi:hypothetical protein
MAAKIMVRDSSLGPIVEVQGVRLSDAEHEMLERYALSRVGYTPDGELMFQPERGRERILPAKAKKHVITIGKPW